MALVKSFDIDHDFHQQPAWAIGWILVCLAACVHRAAWGVLAVSAFVGWGFADSTMQSTHAVLIGWVALILFTTTGTSRLFLLRTQVVAVYLFAALNKANGDFLSGAAIESRTDEIPMVAVVSVLAVLLELWLAWAVWNRSRWAFPMAVPLHVGIVLMMTEDWYDWVMLGSYNSMMLLLIWWVTAPTTRQPNRTRGASRERTRPPG